MYTSKLSVILCAFVFIQLSSCKKGDDPAQVVCNDVSKPIDTYIYPVKPGTPEWRNLTSGDERLGACQVPDSILRTISTEGLIQTWLDFPLVNEIFAVNSLQLGIDYFIVNFSGLRELCKRGDNGDKLFERYKKMNPSCINNYKGDIAKGSYTFTFGYIEMLLGQDTILNKFTIPQKKLLITEAINKYNGKNRYIIDYGIFGSETSMFVCGKAMQSATYQPFLKEVNNSPLLKEFLDSFLLPPDLARISVIMKTILNHSINFVK